MKNRYLLLIFLLGAFNIQAQVSGDPNPALAGGGVTITFDATEGNRGLDAYTGDMYAHTGLITNQSQSSGDWKYVKAGWGNNIPACKMTPLGNNKWSLTISPSIRSYYGVPANEKIRQMAFVFRDAAGSKAGKASGDKDIFLNVTDDGLDAWFISPTSAQQVVVGSSISFLFQASESSLLELFVDNQLIAETTSTTFSRNILFDQEGSFWVIAEASKGIEVVRDSLRVTVLAASENKPRPEGTREGINIVNDVTVTLCLYAPGKQSVHIVGDFNNWQATNSSRMKKDGDYWWLTLTSLVAKQEYAFQYVVDGNTRIADPYTDKILDPWNDAYIPETVYPNLKAYPTGKTEGIVSVFQTGQTAYDWEVNDFKPVSSEKLIIYELLVRDFTGEHSFKSIVTKLDYLKQLGVNAVELMPVNEFEGNDSWGYNPSFYFAVDKYYGTKNDFKSLIDACHQRGIAVIMDMVLNHSYGQSPFVQLYWDAVNQRPAANNPWYNTVSPNPVYSWGYDFNHEKAQTQMLVDSINSYWMKEYKIDGFRFDFTKGFTNKPGDGWAKDASRIQILERMTSEIKKRKTDAIVIFEHLAENSEEIELADAGILLWGNMNNPYCEAIMGYHDASRSNLSNGIYKERGFNQPNLLAYMESHDEERMVYKSKTYGNSGTGYNTKDIATALDRAALSACFYIPLPGPKMIWQFGELGYDYSINTCTDGTRDNNCRLTPKPIRWDYYSEPDRQNLYDSYSKLNFLKQQYPVFSTSDFTYSLAGSVKSFVWKNTDMNAFAIGNFDVTSLPVTLTVPKAGTWYDVFTGESIQLSSTTYTTTLQAGDYHLYTDKKISLPTGLKPILSEEKSSIRIYPNPVEEVLNIAGSEKIEELSIITLQGQTIQQVKNTDRISVSNLKKGIYLLQIKTNETIEVLKFLKK